MKADFLERRLELRHHGLALLVSLLVHAGVLYFLAAHFVSVRIIEFKEPVTPVIIVPPPPLEIPRGARNPANLPAVIEGFPEFLPSRTLSGEAGAPAKEAPAVEEPSENRAVEAFEPKFSEGFRLAQTPPGQPGIVSADRLRLPIPERKKGGTDVLTKTPAPPKNVDWRKYLSASTTGGRWAYRSSTVGGRRVRGDLRGRMTTSASVKRYNLTPWASKVVEVIQKNWEIPPTKPANPDAAVEIVIVLQKNGQVSNLEVIASSEDQSFDQAARFAIELSSPLPPLPDDFPSASLEISFVFSVE
jgi:TonB family protein